MRDQPAEQRISVRDSTPPARKICVVTGSRADYGLLYWIMKDIQADSSLQLQLVATGAHLSSDHGQTVNSIEEDGFTVDCKVDINIGDDSGHGIAQSTGHALAGIATALNDLKPDWVVVLGDRYEIMAAAQAALLMKIPLAHICGGDVTEGAFDDAIRHCISKMAQLHFPSNELAAQRLRQLGENPEHIHVCGSPGIDYIRRMHAMSRAELELLLGRPLRQKNLLLTFHPVTLGNAPSATQLGELLNALERFPELGLIFTRPNADNENRDLWQRISHFVAGHPNASAHASLGSRAYLSLMSSVDAVVGNSSSGLYEAPSLQKPTVNIGDRQKGRLKAVSVIDCAPLADDIAAAISSALSFRGTAIGNPYGDGTASARILAVLKSVADPRTLLQKRFVDVAA